MDSWIPGGCHYLLADLCRDEAAVIPYDCHKETYEGPCAVEAWDTLIEIIDQMLSCNGVLE